MSSSIDAVALVTQFATCLIMTGVIWIIQLAHYPTFALVDSRRFLQFHKMHTKGLGLIAGPVMCLELLSALWLARSGEWMFVTNVIFVFVIWLATFFISVPYHNLLEEAFDEQVCRDLVRTNRIRTIVWTVRSIALVIFLMRVLGNERMY